jgi:hypothetical protein
VTFAAITLCVASQGVFIVVDFVIDSVRKLLDTSSYSHFLTLMMMMMKQQRRKIDITNGVTIVI